MTFDEYVAGAANYFRDNLNQRVGQAYANYLDLPTGANRRDLRDMVQNTHLDPFNMDDRLYMFLDFLEYNW